MIRQAARLAAGWLPQSIRAQLARRRFGYAGTGAALPLTRSTRADGSIAVAMAGGPRFLLPPAMDADFTFHFVENAESRDEMASFMRLSGTGSAGGLLLDVGAHRGLFSIVHLALRPANRAILVEPSPTLAADAAVLLRMNEAADRADVVRAGAGEENGSRRIVVDALGFARPSTGEAGEDVPFLTIDSLCRERGLAPSIVKIDVEGAEAEVLRGARETLQAHHPVVCLELHLDELERRGESTAAMLQELTAMGYRFETPAGRRLAPGRLSRSLMAIARVVAR